MKKAKYILFILVGVLVLPFGVMAVDSPVTLGTPTPTDGVSPTVSTSVSPTQSLRGSASGTTRRTLNAERGVVRQATKALKAAAHCEIIEEKVGLKVARFTNNMSRRQAFYHRFANRVEKIITKFEAAGYDVTKLKADLVVLNQKITTYEQAKTSYIALLKQTQAYSCGNSEGEFAAKLTEAKTQLVKVRQANLDVRTYYQTTIRPDILALKQQSITISPTATATPTTTPTTTLTPTATPTRDIHSVE